MPDTTHAKPPEDGPAMIAALMGHHTQEVQRISLFGLAFETTLVKARGVGQPCG